MKNFGGKVAAITGAGSGIGRALALNLAEKGARLALSDVNGDTVAETAELCAKLGSDAEPYKLNVVDRDAMYLHAEEVRSRFGQVNLIVNNAGVALGAEVLDVAWDDFDWLMNINFWGVVHGTKAFLPHLIESGEGHVANVSSAFGFIGVPSQSAYNAAKFAVRGFTESLTQEMKIGRHPVGVSCVHPGGIKTNIARDARGVEAIADRDVIADGFERAAWTTPKTAAKVIVRGIERNQSRILIGPDAYMMDLLPRALGAGYLSLNSMVFRAGFAQLERRGIKR